MNRTIEIIVSPKGETTLPTRGFTGPACRDASKLIEQDLGQQIGEQLTAEFHQESAQQVEQRQQT
jgi:hypothetical protein